jgi:hypothetical protein
MVIPHGIFGCLGKAVAYAKQNKHGEQLKSFHFKPPFLGSTIKTIGPKFTGKVIFITKPLPSPPSIYSPGIKPAC